ncbi:MAG TPA: glycoside hydrolase family 15 protein [Nitrososphaerales archaeon]|nr:glycoside hydrolase family 15 protein [Nitrososphaerales archaeon]
MPRDIPVGNGNYSILFDQQYRISDIFYPRVGMENHALGHPFRFGAFAEGMFSWLSDWQKTMSYLEDTLASDVKLHSDDMKLEIRCNDCVDFVSPIFMRKIRVRNLAANPREVRLFFHHDFHIRGTAVGDTAYFDPVKTSGVVHYKTDRYFLANSRTNSGEGIFQYACGVKESAGALGTWKDAEDGYLSGNPIAQGAVDSVISVRLAVDGNKESECNYWIIAGKSYDEVQRRNSFLNARTPEKLFKRTIDFWRLWATRRDHNGFEDLGDQISRLYRRSLLIIKSQTDADGAIIASNDSDILQFNKDTYAYMWPRDGAFVTMAMDEAGYRVFSKHFFDFCLATILPQGWYFHKYQADKSPGSSWHPWVVAGQQQLPIQEDETALVLISLWNHYRLYKDVDMIKDYYGPIIKSAANFINDYRDKTTLLPLESYDLWEERREVLTFTCSAIFAALSAAANFAEAFGEADLAIIYRRGAEEVKQAMIKNLYDAALGRFLRGVTLENGAVVSNDSTIDASIAGVFLFGVLPADDPLVVSSMSQVEEKLWIKTPVGGLARYEQDRYQVTGEYQPNVPGNPWFITTMWLADWYIEKSKTKRDLGRAKELLTWASEHAMPSGVMAEQLNPFNGSALSVSPLTWSHAAFTEAVNRYLGRYPILPP